MERLSTTHSDRIRPSTTSYPSSTPLETVVETLTPTTTTEFFPTTTTTTAQATTAEMASAAVSWSTNLNHHHQHHDILSGTSQNEIPCCEGPPYQPLAPAWSSEMHDKSMSGLSRPALLPSVPASLGLMKNSWGQKPYEESLEFYPFDPEAPIGQAYTTDEAVPIIDLRFSTHHHRQDLDSLNRDTEGNRRSASSMTVSTCGPLSDLPSSFEDFAANLSDPPAFTDYPDLSNRNSLMSSSQFSPNASPRNSIQSHSRPDQMRTQSRTGRASSSPRPSARVAPYSLDAHRGGARWSSASYNSVQNRLQSPYPYSTGQDTSSASQRLSLQLPSTSMPHSTFPAPNMNFHRPQIYTAGSLLSQNKRLMTPPNLSSQMHPQSLLPEPPRLPQAPTLASHGLLRMLQNNNDSYSLRSHYADFADPPDLYASLHEEACQPPPEDMNPSDPDMVPYEQEVRFEGDLYTPMLVRGHGNKREGWCGLCKPGRWLVLKNSAYWYDKSFTHGISAATGQAFQEPLDKRRMDGNPDVWEGLCGSCNEWIALVSSKKKGTTWFRHAYKCHTHAKVKDVPKRRRENHQNRLSASSQASPSTTLKSEPDRLTTPRTSYTPLSTTSTPNHVPLPIYASDPGSRQYHQQLTPQTPSNVVRSNQMMNSSVSTPLPPYGNMI